MWNDPDSEQEELCLIDSRIKSLRQVPLRSQLQVINLHCNQITQIEGLEYLQHLRHLDLSSNQIRDIEGLEYLVNLRTLNLACNLIEVAQGLHNLRNLVKLNLSYNQIESLTGMQSLRGSDYKLNHIELQGNRLQSAAHVGQCLQGCVNLRRLELSQGGASNPVCQIPGYRDTVLSALPMLHSLDEHDRLGRPSVTQDALTDIPGLEKYMEYLTSNNASMTSDTNQLDLVTPAIDAALEKFRLRAVTTSDLSSSALPTSDHDLSHGDRPRSINVSHNSQGSTRERSDVAQESRLEKLENQLAELLRTKGHERQTAKLDATHKHKAKRDIDDTDESETESRSRGTRTRHTTRLPSYQKSTAASRRKTQAQMCSSDELLVTGASPPRTPTSRSPARTPNPTGAAHTHAAKESSSELSSSGRHVPLAGTQNTDERLRDDMKNTYVSLMGELETERERRWKAERATKKLVEHVRHLQSNEQAGRDTQDLTEQATQRLQSALAAERENKLKLQAEVEILQEQLNQQLNKLDKTENLCEKANTALRDVQVTSTRREQEVLQQQAHEAKKLQEVTMRASASQRELEIVRGQVKGVKVQLHQMQELLATREQEHRKDLTGRYTVESREFQDMLVRETAKLEKLHTQELNLQQQRVDSLTDKYSELEDEFRLALHIENKRFTELQDAYQGLSDDAAKDRRLLDALQRKDGCNADMVNELTQLVKEQKGRITELARAKQEQSVEYRERVSTLESHLEEARKRMVQLEMLKQEKVKLLSQVQAQESVIVGLKAERKLWGEELAQQGAALGQDRGRMEAKIESLMSEVIQVKRLLDRETDAVKIKTKIIEDQTETIRKLKQGLLERDEEIRKVREESLKMQKDLEEQVSAELSASQELQSKLERARERKDELKQEINELEDKLIDIEKAHGDLNSQWKKKSSAISELEKQVTFMKETWLTKERKLTDDRDKALQAARIAVDKIKSVDDAFRQQLDAKEQNHARAMYKLQQQTQDEVNQANKRVLEVEQEMRELLGENESNKRDMEEKVKKLTRAMTELQTGLF